MPLVELAFFGPVAQVTLTRPPVNALSEELAVELKAVLEQCQGPEVRSLVITGKPHFAAGADIRGFAHSHSSGGNEQMAETLLDALWLLEGLNYPTIAAINGYALGGGLELAMAADFRYCAVDATLGQPEIKLGMIPGAGGTQRLPRIVGYQRAKDIVYSGRNVRAEEALAIGLADRVLPADEVLEEAMTTAQSWAQGPTVALGAAKRALNQGWGEPLRSAMEIEARSFQDCFWSDDAREGVEAFIDKRAANFQGR